MTGLVIFTIVALAGCAFLIYFMFALWRDSRDSRKGPRVEIRSREFPMSVHSHIHKEAMAIQELPKLTSLIDLRGKNRVRR